MTEKEIKSLCCLSTFAWTFPATSAVHFLAFAFLATTFWSKECVMTGIEGLMSSGSVTDVTGTLFRMRSTFYWTVRMNIWSDFAHSNSLRQTFQASVEVRLKRLISTAVEMRLKFCRSTAGVVFKYFQPRGLIQPLQPHFNRFFLK